MSLAHSHPWCGTPPPARRSEDLVEGPVGMGDTRHAALVLTGRLPVTSLPLPVLPPSEAKDSLLVSLPFVYKPSPSPLPDSFPPSTSDSSSIQSHLTLSTSAPHSYFSALK